MNLDIVLPLVVAVVLAFIGYIVTYINDLRLTRRKERLELVNKRINEFYGPLYIASLSGAIAYETLLQKLGRSAVFDASSPPNEYELTEWRVWSKMVFMPLNDFREKLILENAHLIREEEMPECLYLFVTHVSAYKAIISKWEMGDFSENTPLLDYPAQVNNYAEKSYKELKAEQLRLIGTNK